MFAAILLSVIAVLSVTEAKPNLQKDLTVEEARTRVKRKDFIPPHLCDRNCFYDLAERDRIVRQGNYVMITFRQYENSVTKRICYCYTVSIPRS
jgi:hypothetical protein